LKELNETEQAIIKTLTFLENNAKTKSLIYQTTSKFDPYRGKWACSTSKCKKLYSRPKMRRTKIDSWYEIFGGTPVSFMGKMKLSASNLRIAHKWSRYDLIKEQYVRQKFRNSKLKKLSFYYGKLVEQQQEFFRCCCSSRQTTFLENKQFFIWILQKPKLIAKS